LWTTPISAAPSAPSAPDAAPIEIHLPSPAHSSALPLRVSKSRGRSSWIWTALVSAMILLVIFLALVVISH